MPKRLNSLTSRLLPVAMAAAGLTAVHAVAAQAAASGPDGLIAALSNDQKTITTGNPDGSDMASFAPPGGAGRPVWSPDGRHLVYQDSRATTLTMSRPDGSDPVQLVPQAAGGTYSGPSFYDQGARVAFSENGPGGWTLMSVSTDGDQIVQPLVVPSPGDCDSDLSVSGDEIAFYRQQGCTGTGAVWILDTATHALTQVVSNVLSFNLSPDGSRLVFTRAVTLNGVADDELFTVNADGNLGTTPSLLIADAMDPVLSPDGTRIAFLRPDADGIDQVFTMKADGTGTATQVTQDSTGDADPAWSPDGTQIAYTNPYSDMVYEVSATDGTVLGSIPNASSPSFQPDTQGHLVRLWGSNAIGTAIAASQYNWAAAGTADPTRGQAGAVVLSRSDQFYDALTGSALAAVKGGPLLTTPPTQLEPQVLAEIERVLAPGGTVYLLGGTSALSPAVAGAVTAAGFTVDRLAGSNEYGTAVAVDEAMTSHPTQVMVATGVSYYDALSAGAAAAREGAVLVLTDNGEIPPASAAYLDTLDPKSVPYYAIGGPGAEALEYDSSTTLTWGQFSFHELVGANAKDTAYKVAVAYFPEITDVAVATDTGWYDALSGGAMIGTRGGPLLLTDPGSLYSEDVAYLESKQSTLTGIEMMGGTAALPTALQDPLGATFGTPWQYYSFEPGSPELPFTAVPGGSTPAVPGRAAVGGVLRRTLR